MLGMMAPPASLCVHLPPTQNPSHPVGIRCGFSGVMVTENSWIKTLVLCQEERVTARKRESQQARRPCVTSDGSYLYVTIQWYTSGRLEYRSKRSIRSC